MNNDTFQWTPDLVEEFVLSLYNSRSLFNDMACKKKISDFQQSKIPKMKIEPSYILLRNLPNISKKTPIYLSVGGDSYTCKDKFGGNATLNKKLVETNPDWFELQPQTVRPHRLSDRQPKKEWEIIQLKGVYSGFIYNKKDGMWLAKHDNGWGANEDPIKDLEDSGCNIHSVRRLSDSVVFTVGDKIQMYQTEPIERFEIRKDDGKMIVYFKTAWANITELQKPQPKKERIEVTNIKEARFYSSGVPQCTLTVDIKRIINNSCEEKFPAIKAAIERVLNNESEIKFISNDWSAVGYYTLSQLREAEVKAFNAAREPYYLPVQGGYLYKHTTFQDYVNNRQID